MSSDIEIAHKVRPLKIQTIAKRLGLKQTEIIPYGHYMAKIALTDKKKTNGKLVLVTAMTPTPAGEGKSTVSIGLADALCRLKQKSILSLREPSMGPCFGVKGGATGGGHSQIIPMEDINLNFTGDLHAITSANNLLAAMIDNHIHHGNALRIKTVFFKRCVDMNDRTLRQTEIGLGGKTNGTPRSESFTITAASEIMAILCLSENLADLKKRLGKIVIGEDDTGTPVLARDIKAVGAMCAILRDAVKPNLVQTLEHTPALVHGGPFANIAHGTSSVIAAKTALSLADYVITEAGFGADLGAEKFFDIFGRQTGLFPDCVIVVATIRALKMHGGVSLTNLQDENLAALQRGFGNLKAHLLNLQLFGITPIVALNAFNTDTKEETDLLLTLCHDMHIQAFVSNGWRDGSKGCITLAEEVINVCKNTSPHVNLLYQDNDTLYNKIRTIAQKIYHAKDVSLTAEAEKTLAKFTHWGYDKLPVCIAKTQNSLSHDKNLLGAPEGYTLPISEVRLSAGAGFVVVLTGTINTMPGLPEHPAAEAIDTDNTGNIIGLF